MNKPYRFDTPTRTDKENSYSSDMEKLMTECEFSNVEKAENFPLFTSRQQLAKYLARYEIFKMIENVHGSIVECGVLYGGGLMLMAQLSAIMEPVNTTRKIIGFDTFQGFTEELATADSESKSTEAKQGGFNIDSYATLTEAARLYDQNRPIGHSKKVELVRGDALKTIPAYVEKNKSLVVSCLVLDFDIAEPTLVALENFVPLMPKGGIIIFDELGVQNWNETEAVKEYFFGIHQMRVKRFPFTSTTSYMVVE